MDEGIFHLNSLLFCYSSCMSVLSMGATLYCTFSCSHAVLWSFKRFHAPKCSKYAFLFLLVAMPTVCIWRCRVCNRFLFTSRRSRHTHTHLILCLQRLVRDAFFVVSHIRVKANTLSAAAVCECVFTLCISLAPGLYGSERVNLNPSLTLLMKTGKI